MSANKRRHPRNAVVLRVDGADKAGRAWMSLAHNLSRGGLQLAHHAPVAVGETLTVTFVLPSGQPCKLPARVVRADETGYALEFQYDLPESVLPTAQTQSEPLPVDSVSFCDNNRDKPPLESEVLETSMIANQLLARWFGVPRRLPEETQEALGQILPSSVLFKDADDMAHTCAMHLMGLLEQWGTLETASLREVSMALEAWHQRARALHAAMAERTVALASMIEATTPQTVLELYHTLLTRQHTAMSSTTRVSSSHAVQGGQEG